MFELPPADEMRRAHCNRDASYDGLFYVAVKTTGIFCRPSCPARTPHEENVDYLPSVSAALFGGFRPCRRCRPLEASGRLPEWAADLVRDVTADPSQRLDDAALRERGLDPARVRRFFKGQFGMTFHAFRRAHRLGRALEVIRAGTDATGAGFDVGYESTSGFRDAFARFFGQPPGRSDRAAGISVTWVPTPIGPLLAGATGDGVCLVEFPDRRALEAQLDSLRRHFSRPLVPATHPHLEQVARELDEYFAGARRRFDTPIDDPGTPFQCRVWQALRRIPYGQTTTYEQLAVDLGSPGAQRAVGHANGANRVAILNPCHRVVSKDGTLGGYGGGLWRKAFLLDLERTSILGKQPVAEPVQPGA